MISQEIMDLLMSVLPKTAKVTIYGDPYQLPTITGEPIQIFEPHTELNVQYRSVNDKATRLFMAYKDYISGATTKLPENTYKPTPNWRELFNPDTDRVVAFTNSKVVQLNNIIADKKPYSFNDSLLMNGIPVIMTVADYNPRIYPSCMAKGELMPQKKLVSASKQASGKINQYRVDLSSYPQTSVVVDGAKFLIYYDPEHYATELVLKADVEKYQKLVVSTNKLGADVNIPEWCRANKGARGVKNRGQAWSKFLAHRNYVFNLARPYVTTVHKAQGSEFRAIFIDEDNLSMIKSKNPMMYARLMYVALSRGIEEVYFV